MSRKTTKRKIDRKLTLLVAAYKLFKKIKKCPDQNPLSLTVVYDGADCDSECLTEDIEYELDLYEEIDPIFKR